MNKITGQKSMRSVRTVYVVGLCIIFIFGQWSCATQPPTFPAELRAELGTIGVVSAQYMPEPDFEGPGAGFQEHASGAWKGLKSGAKEGAKRGASTVVSIVEHFPNELPFMLLGLVLIAVGTTAGTITGSLGGLTMGMIDPTDNNLTKDPATLKPIFDGYLKELDMQAKIRKEVVAVAKENTSHQVIELEKEGPAQRGGAVSYQTLKEQNLDTVLEVSVLSLGMKSTSSSDPTFSIFLVVRADIRRVADDALLYRASFTHTSPSQPLDGWMLSNALAFRMALDKGYRMLAEQVVSKLL